MIKRVGEWVRHRVWNIVQWLLFRFDAETAHQITTRLIRLGILFRGKPLIWMSDTNSLILASPGVSVLGMEFRNRVGLAAGFDKNAELLEGLPQLGFGFAEIGTVTPKPQSGNPKPRLFRDIDRQAIFNRMGFNGLGAALVSERVRSARLRLPSDFKIGINIGKNKDTPNEEAHLDYMKAARAFEGLADYLVINVSSPNTPGLRSLQTASALEPIVQGVMEVISQWRKAPPLLLKIAPELPETELFDLVSVVEQWGIQGWVLTNTLGGSLKTQNTELTGGWSGKLLALNSRSSLETLRRISQKPVISVGGIMNEQEAQSRIAAGAQLIQIYTGWIYHGPTFPARLAVALRSQG
jgi:dihydroorotate dehydrogenase